MLNSNYMLFQKHTWRAKKITNTFICLRIKMKIIILQFKNMIQQYSCISILST